MDEFFIVIVVAFWILSGIVNAIQRKMSGGAREEDDGRLGGAEDETSGAPAREPTRVRLPQGSTEGTTAEDFLRRIEALARGQLPPLDVEPPQQRRPARPGPLPVPPSPPSSAPGSPPVAAPVPVARSAPPPVEPRSDRWTTGTAGDAGQAVEGPSLEGISAEAAAERSRHPQTLPSRVREVREPRSRQAAVMRAPRRTAREIREGPGAERVAPGTGPSLPLGSVRDLAGLSRSELRRVIVLQEVLGPPLALRDGPPGSPAAAE
jgi:hypothetical protein